jgi:hypothetical protein
LQATAGKEDGEWKKYAKVTARQKRLFGERRLEHFGLDQADTLEELTPRRDVGVVEIWLRRRGRTTQYDWVGAWGGALDGVMPWVPSRVKDADPAQPDKEFEKWTQDEKALKAILAAFEALQESWQPPLFTPAELKHVEPLVTLPVLLKTDARGFAPSVVEWKDLALKPSDKRFVGYLPEPSAFEKLFIWAVALATGAWAVRSMPIWSPTPAFNGGAVFVTPSDMRHPERI